MRLEATPICDPITIAGIALTAGSTVANSIGQARIQKARDSALAAERIRQNQFDQEAQALNTKSQDRYQDFEGQQDQRGSELGQYFADQQIEQGGQDAAAAVEQSTAPTSSNLTIREEAKQRGNARDFTNRQGAALGELRAFGDVLGSTGILQARDASQIGQIGGFKRGSSGVVPLELEQANNAGNGMKMLGDVLNLGGGLAMSKGLSGGKAVTAAADPWGGMRSMDPWNAMRSKTGSLYNLYGN